MSVRRSIIWKIPLDEFKKLVEESSSITECLTKIGLVNKGRNNITFLKRVEEDGISIDHIRKMSSHIAMEKRRLPLEQYLVYGREIKGSAIKKRLVESGLLKDECSVCGQLPEWNGKPLSLELDHINGNRLDNRIENLRVICPHCHSQTDTFRGRANKGKKYYQEPVKYYCQDCGDEISDNKAVRCVSCYKISSRKTNRPDLNTLQEDIKNLGFCGTGRKYGVSDNAIRKWVKNYNERKIGDYQDNLQGDTDTL